jgi:HSP20 family protein
MDRVFEESFGPVADYAGRELQANPKAKAEYRLPIDAYVTEGEIVVQAALPGVAPENVTISLEGEALTISAELPARVENVTYTVAERRVGKFSRTITLNVDVEADKAEAKFNNGLLTLRLPKAEAVKPKQIKVTAK